MFFLVLVEIEPIVMDVTYFFSSFPGFECSNWSGLGGWWYFYCHRCNPTGVYEEDDLPADHRSDILIEWQPWQGRYHYLDAITMMVRPSERREQHPDYQPYQPEPSRG